MEPFFQSYKHLVETREPHIRRTLMDEIDFSYRLICILGTRGVGKTSFLLDYAAEHFSPDSRECLYVNLNHFYFSERTLYDFAREFNDQGGRVLLIDQVFKYPQWAEELANCYHDFPTLHIIFTGSSVMSESHPNEVLCKEAKVYRLYGFSFREYFNFINETNYGPVTFDDILKNHADISASIVYDHHPAEAFVEYTKQGYYPSQPGVHNYTESLVKTLNMLLEVDVVYIRQIDPSYLYKLRKLLYLIASHHSNSMNISVLSKDIGTSRATVMNYLKYLSDAEVIRMLYKRGDVYPKKPHKIYISNPNIANIIYPHIPSSDDIRKMFLFSHLAVKCDVNAPEVSGADFLVNGKQHIKVTEMMKKMVRPNITFAVDSLSVGHDEQVPLWLFGFLY